VTVIDQMLERPPVIMDGAMGTVLQALGLPAGTPPEAWNLDRPEAVREVSRAYAREGADVVLTNTFGANRARLGSYAMDDRVEAVNRAAAALAREGAGPAVLVGGSVGPSGLCTGIDPPSAAELTRVFSEQCGALKDGGVDLLVLETFYDLHEFRAALEAAAAAGLPFTATMTFQETPRGFFTIMGVTPGEALDEARRNGARAAGANCTIGSEAMTRLTALMRAHGPGHLAASPNAGMPELEGERTVYRQSAEDFAADAAATVAAGATMVGGCCGTTPEFVREMRAVLKTGKRAP
jgi:5-methyltetrahydrofolate--homocysteine methyltransferase